MPITLGLYCGFQARLSVFVLKLVVVSTRRGDGSLFVSSTLDCSTLHVGLVLSDYWEGFGCFLLHSLFLLLVGNTVDPVLAMSLL